MCGRMTKRSPGVTLTVVGLALVVAVLGGMAIFLHFYAAGNCGE